MISDTNTIFNNYTMKITRNQILAIKATLEKEGKRLSPNSTIVREYKSSLVPLTSYQKEAGIGHLLGDARIEKGKSRNFGGHLLKFEYGDKNKDYAFSIYNLYKDYCLTEPRKQVRMNRNGNNVTTWCFQTLLHNNFNELGNLFLDDKGKKHVPIELFHSQQLSPVTLARWFMDDGGMNGSHSHGIQLHTQSFTEQEVDCMIVGLNNQYCLHR
jgi:hypothetical protein